MDRFVSLLAEAGITVTPDDEQSTEHSQQEQRAAQNSFTGVGGRLESREGQNGVLSSAETLAGEEEVARSPYEPSFGIKADAQDSARRTTGRRTRRSRSEDTHMRVAGLDRGRLNAHITLEQVGRNRPRRTGSVSSTRSLRIQRPRRQTFGNGDAYSADESESSNATRSRRHSVSDAPPAVPTSAIQDARSFLPLELLQRSEEQMAAIAETFQETKGVPAQRRILSRWSQKAAQLKAGHDQLQTLARNVDRHKLLRDSFLVWRQKLDDKRLDRAWEENESFFTALEETATSEREVNLKWIAFSHWKQMTKDEQQRTSVARRHILRRRYFNAWSNVTAVNDIKVRRFVLRKFFTTWQQKSQRVQSQSQQAVAKYESNVVHRIYRTWFFNFLERSAPDWHDSKRRREYLWKWRDAARHTREKEREAEELAMRKLQRNTLLYWRAKARPLQDLEATAESFRRRNLLNECLMTWKREAVLTPRAAQLTLRVDQRILGGLFRLWHRYTNFSRQAAQVQNQRVLRNTFTAWNEQVRIKFLQDQIDIRLRSESLYTWRIAALKNEAERTKNRSVARHALQNWLSKAQNRHRSIEGAEHTFEVSQRRRTLHSALGKLTSVWQHQQRSDAQAEDFREARLLYGALAKWQQKNAGVELLNRKAKAAEFYILTTKTLKTWSRSTEDHRKMRKREAYGQIRRLCKVNVAREMLRRMQIQLAHVRNMDRFSLEFREDHVVKSTGLTLSSWKERAVTCVQQERQAEDTYNRKLMSAVMRRLVERKTQLQEMNTQAREFSGGSAAVEAISGLRKMDRRLFQIKGQEQWALALRDKHWEKHLKNMLRYWHEKTIVARRQQDELARGGLGDVDFRASTASAPPLGDLSVFDTTAWNLGPLDLNLNTFADGAQGEIDATFFESEGIITSTPLPGYLRTPSKRNTARAKARERLAANAPATTVKTIRFADQIPATAPPRQQTASAPPVLPSPSQSHNITPFERKLREQGYTSPSPFGNRTPGQGGPSRFAVSVNSASVGRRFGVNTPARGGFAGFEDIPEVSEERSRDL
jgi:protein SFI1